MQVSLTKSFSFDSAHWLPCFPEGHKCRRLHGHSFQVEIEVTGEVPEDKGYLVDYGDLKAATQHVHDQVDHRCLNEIPGLENPTSEVIARWIWRELEERIPLLTAVTVKETCNSSCTYRGT